MGKIKVAIIDALSGHVANDYFNFGLCSALIQNNCLPTLYANKNLQKHPGVQFEIMTPYSKDIYSQLKPIWWRVILYVVGTVQAVFSAFLNQKRIVHYHFFNAGHLELFNICCAKIFFRKLVITLHDIESLRVGRNRLPEKVVSWMYSLVDRVVVLSEVARREVLCRINPNKIVLIPHGNYLGVIPSLLDQKTARKTLSIDEKDFVCLFFGGIDHHKGLDLLIQAFSHLPNKQGIKLLVAGKQQRNHLVDYKKLADEANVYNNCIFKIELISTDEMALCFSAADLVVLPYRNIYQSGVLLMAMSYQKPVLVSDIPGMTEVIQTQHNGLTFRTEDIDDLAKKIQWSRENRNRLLDFGYEGFCQIQNKNDWNQIARQTVRCYREVLSKEKVIH